MTVSVLLRIMVSISVSGVQRADSSWASPSVFFDVIVFGWDGIVTVFDIQGLFFVFFLSTGIFTDFFHGSFNVVGIVLGSVMFFVSVGLFLITASISSVRTYLISAISPM